MKHNLYAVSLILALFSSSPAFSEESISLFGDISQKFEQARIMPVDTLEMSLARYLSLRELEFILQKLQNNPQDNIPESDELVLLPDLQSALLQSRDIVTQHCDTYLPKSCLFEQVLTGIETREKSPDVYRGLQNVIPMLVEARDMEGLDRLRARILYAVENLKNPIYRASLLTSLSLALKDSTDSNTAVDALTSALQIADAFSDTKKRILGLIAVANAFAEIGQTETSNNVFNEVAQLTSASIPSDLRAYEISPIATAFAKAGKPELAQEIASQITDPQTQGLVLSSIVRSFLKLGKIEPALQTARSIKSSVILAFSLNDIAISLTEMGDSEAAAELYTEALQAAAQEPNEYERGRPYNAITFALVDAGNLVEARRVAEMIKDPIMGAQPLSYLALGYANAGDMQNARVIFAQAEFVAKSISPLASARTFAFMALANAWAKSGYLGEAIRVAELISKDYKRVKSISDIAQILAESGNWQDAYTLIAQSLELAESIEDTKERGHALATVAEAMAHIGMFAQSYSTILSIESQSRRNGALSTLARQL